MTAVLAAPASGAAGSQRTGIDDVNESKRTLLPALLAVSGGIAAADAGALELGDLNVHSGLGQPLRASVAFALRPNESVTSQCVSVLPGGPASGLPTMQGISVRVADGFIWLTSRSFINEPISALRVDINCPYTPRLAREYVVFLDPVGTVPLSDEPPAALPVARPPERRPTQAPVVANRPARRPAAPATPIPTGERYRVQPGDTLSQIAQRIDNRSVKLWTAVAEIFEANPGAFIDDDPNFLKAGTWIVIPDSARGGPALADDVAAFDAGTSVAAVSPPVAAAGPDAGIAGAGTYDLASDPAAGDDTAVLEPVKSTESAEPLSKSAPRSAAADPGTRALQPGDVIILEDTALPAAEPAPATVDGAAGSAVEADGGNASWGWWFAGGGLVLLGGLVVYSRRRIAASPPPAVDPDDEVRQEPRYLEEAPEVEVVESQTVEADDSLGYEIEDDSPTQENLTIDALVVDADLENGTGLNPQLDVEVAEDFGFASSAAFSLDLEFPADAAADDDFEEQLADTLEREITIEDDSADTDDTTEVEVAHGIDTTAESERPDIDDDYDMSILVDATTLRDDTQITERDLQAIVVGGVGDEPQSENYTVSKEVDYTILSTDYEDELTATQALNQEIERAAAELAERMEPADDDEIVIDDDEVDNGRTTSQMATVTPIDAQSDDDNTAEMPFDDDNTAEMPIKSGKRS